MKVALGGGGRTAARHAGRRRWTSPASSWSTQRVDGLEKSALRGLSDSLRDRLGSGVVVLASESDGKVALVVSVTKDLTGRVQAGRLVKELAPIVGGGGGGRPDFAEAGGKDPSKIDELLASGAGGPRLPPRRASDRYSLITELIPGCPVSDGTSAWACDLRKSLTGRGHRHLRWSSRITDNLLTMFHLMSSHA